MSVRSIVNFQIRVHKKIRVLRSAAAKLCEARVQLFGAPFVQMYVKRSYNILNFWFWRKYYISIHLFRGSILICLGLHVGYHVPLVPQLVAAPVLWRLLATTRSLARNLYSFLNALLFQWFLYQWVIDRQHRLRITQYCFREIYLPFYTHTPTHTTLQFFLNFVF